MYRVVMDRERCWPTAVTAGWVSNCGASRGHRQKQLYRRFVECAGQVEVEEGRVVVRLDKRGHKPVLREAQLDREQRPVPWLENRIIDFVYL